MNPALVAAASITGGFLSNHGPLTGPIIAPAGMTSGFDAANWSSKRGYVYYPTVETKAELDSYSRTEILRRGRYLTRNVGFAKRCIHGLARMAGWMSPVPLTKDKEWNRLAAESFERKYGASPLGFDAQGRQNFYSYQPMVTATRMQDGDFFTALTEGASGQAMVMSYEAHQIGNGEFAAGTTWRDGVRVDRLQRAWGFNVLDGEGKGTEIDARNMIQHADFLSIGHTRAPSVLHHAVTHLLDRTELLSDLKVGSKIANRAAMYVVNQLPQQRTGAPTGMTVTSGATTMGTATQWTMQDLYSPEKRGGKIAELGAGQEVRQLLDQRPHPNTLEFLDYLCRDIAAGLDMAPEVLWNIAKLGGASVRYVMADAQKTIERLQQLLVDQFLTRFWVYFVSKEMAAKRLRPCEDPDWYMVGWQPQAKLTVDIGREGKLSIDLHQAGMLTLQAWYGQQGQDWKHQVEQQIEEYAFKVQACAAASERYGFKIEPKDVWAEMVQRGVDPQPGLEEMDVTKATPEELAA